MRAQALADGGFKAGDWAKEVMPLVNGKGGGAALVAQGAGDNDQGVRHPLPRARLSPRAITPSPSPRGTLTYASCP